MAQIHRSLNVVLLGKAGVGKSATGNTILGREVFISKKSFTSVTQEVAVVSSTVCGRPVTVYDTPAVLDSEQSEEKIQQIYEVLQKCESCPCAFLLVIKADRFTEEERKTVEKIEKVLGVKRKRKTWILITRGDQLEDDDMTIEEFISDYEALKKLLQKYDQRYCVFNNKNSGQSRHTEQVQELLTKILETNSYTTGATNRKQLPLQMKIPKSIEPDTPAASFSSRRIVLLGKSGFGKSSAANTILGQREFRCMRGMTPVTSECSLKHATVSGRSVSVVDTPGFFHTQMNTEELKKEIMRSVYLSSSGPHAFLIVFRVDVRVTDQELQIPQLIEMMFGVEVLKYSIILFTCGDQLEEKPIEELIEENSRLRDLVDQCGGRFHVFNNEDENNRDQVNDLLKKIDTMIEQNGGGHYSNQMIEDAQRLRQEEERKQREEKQRQEETERVIKETEDRVRAEFEGPPRCLLERLKSIRLIEEERKRREEERQQEFERFEHLHSSRRPKAIHMERKMTEWQRKHRVEKQRREEIERVINETEEEIRAEFEGPPRFLLERFKAMRLREEEEKKQREEKQVQEEIERVIKETEERIRAEFEGPPRFLLYRLKAMRLSMEDRIQQEVERQEKFGSFFDHLFLFSSMRHMEMQRKLREEIERVIKEIRAEFEGPPR